MTILWQNRWIELYCKYFDVQDSFVYHVDFISLLWWKRYASKIFFSVFDFGCEFVMAGDLLFYSGVAKARNDTWRIDAEQGRKKNSWYNQVRYEEDKLNCLWPRKLLARRWRSQFTQKRWTKYQEMNFLHLRRHEESETYQE